MNHSYWKALPQNERELLTLITDPTGYAIDKSGVADKGAEILGTAAAHLAAGLGADEATQGAADDFAKTFAREAIRDGIQDGVDRMLDNPTPNGADSTQSPVRPGDRGPYTDLKSRKDRVGETEPLEMHEMPSYAAKERAFISEFGREPKPNERRMLRDAGVSEAVPPPLHRQTRTYGGRNSPQQVRRDASDLDAARNRDEEDLRQLKRRGN